MMNDQGKTKMNECETLLLSGENGDTGGGGGTRDGGDSGGHGGGDSAHTGESVDSGDTGESGHIGGGGDIDSDRGDIGRDGGDTGDGGDIGGRGGDIGSRGDTGDGKENLGGDIAISGSGTPPEIVDADENLELKCCGDGGLAEEVEISGTGVTTAVVDGRGDDIRLSNTGRSRSTSSTEVTELSEHDTCENSVEPDLPHSTSAEYQKCDDTVDQQKLESGSQDENLKCDDNSTADLKPGDCSNDEHIDAVRSVEGTSRGHDTVVGNDVTPVAADSTPPPHILTVTYDSTNKKAAKNQRRKDKISKRKEKKATTVDNAPKKTTSAKDKPQKKDKEAKREIDVKSQLEYHRMEDKSTAEDLHYYCPMCCYHCHADTDCIKHMKRDKHRQKLKMIHIAEEIAKVPHPTKDHMDKLDQFLSEVVDDVGLSKDQRVHRVMVMYRLEKLLQGCLPACSLRMYGSTLTGCCLTSSDANIDVTIPSYITIPKALTAMKDFLINEPSLEGCVQFDFTSSCPSVTITKADKPEDVITTQIDADTILSHTNTCDTLSKEMADVLQHHTTHDDKSTHSGDIMPKNTTDVLERHTTHDDETTHSADSFPKDTTDDGPQLFTESWSDMMHADSASEDVESTHDDDPDQINIEDIELTTTDSQENSSPTYPDSTVTHHPSPTHTDGTPTNHPSPTHTDATPTNHPSPTHTDTTPTNHPSHTDGTPTHHPSPTHTDATPTNHPSPTHSNTTPTNHPSPTHTDATPTNHPSTTHTDTTPPHNHHTTRYVLSMGNNDAVSTCQLLREFMTLDPRVKPLALVHRQWFKICEMDRPHQGTMPAYLPAILTIFFLQNTDPPVLPVVKEGKTLSPNWLSPNNDSLADLWLQLLRFFANDFDYTEHVVSLRERFMQISCKTWRVKNFAVEDPTVTQKNIVWDCQSQTLVTYLKDCYLRSFKYFNTMPGQAVSSLSFLSRQSSTESGKTSSDDDAPDTTDAAQKAGDESGSDSASGSEVMERSGVTVRSEVRGEGFTLSLQTLANGKGPNITCSLCHKVGHVKVTCPSMELPPLEPVANPTHEFMKILNGVLDCLTNTNSLTQGDMHCRAEILRDLQMYIRQYQYRDACLRLFGSSINGLGFHNSDLDICMTFDMQPTLRQEVDPKTVIMRLARILRQHPCCSHVYDITSAKVPIVKFVYHLPRKVALEADISLYNLAAIENTHLLQTYIKIDSRVRTLGFAIKYFVKVCEIGDASRGSLSSYAYMLMLLHYLQHTTPPVLPVLQEIPDKYRKPKLVDGHDTWFFDDVNALSRVWPDGKNQQSVSELWIGLLRYYTETFDFTNHVISVRQSEYLMRFEKLWNTQCIAIEDPFVLTHNLGAGLSHSMSQFILKALRKAREHFCCHIEQLPNVRGVTWQTYLFDEKQLTDGHQPTDKRCNICGKIGHSYKDCLLRGKGKQKQNKQKKNQEKKVAAKDSVKPGPKDNQGAKTASPTNKNTNALPKATSPKSATNNASQKPTTNNANAKQKSVSENTNLSPKPRTDGTKPQNTVATKSIFSQKTQLTESTSQSHVAKQDSTKSVATSSDKRTPKTEVKKSIFSKHRDDHINQAHMNESLLAAISNSTENSSVGIASDGTTLNIVNTLPKEANDTASNMAGGGKSEQKSGPSTTKKSSASPTPRQDSRESTDSPTGANLSKMDRKAIERNLKKVLNIVTKGGASATENKVEPGDNINMLLTKLTDELNVDQQPSDASVLENSTSHGDEILAKLNEQYKMDQQRAVDASGKSQNVASKKKKRNKRKSGGSTMSNSTENSDGDFTIPPHEIVAKVQADMKQNPQKQKQHFQQKQHTMYNKTQQNTQKQNTRYTQHSNENSQSKVNIGQPKWQKKSQQQSSQQNAGVSAQNNHPVNRVNKQTFQQNQSNKNSAGFNFAQNKQNNQQNQQNQPQHKQHYQQNQSQNKQQNQSPNKPHYQQNQSPNKPQYQQNQSPNKPQYQQNQSQNKPQYQQNQSPNKPQYQQNQSPNKQQYQQNQSPNKPHYQQNQSQNKPQYQQNQSPNKPQYQQNQPPNKPHYQQNQSQNKPQYQQNQSQNKPQYQQNQSPNKAQYQQNQPPNKPQYQQNQSPNKQHHQSPNKPQYQQNQLQNKPQYQQNQSQNKLAQNQPNVKAEEKVQRWKNMQHQNPEFLESQWNPDEMSPAEDTSWYDDSPQKHDHSQKQSQNQQSQNQQSQKQTWQQDEAFSQNRQSPRNSSQNFYNQSSPQKSANQFSPQKSYNQFSPQKPFNQSPQKSDQFLGSPLRFAKQENQQNKGYKKGYSRASSQNHENPPPQSPNQQPKQPHTTVSQQSIHAGSSWYEGLPLNPFQTLPLTPPNPPFIQNSQPTNNQQNRGKILAANFMANSPPNTNFMANSPPNPNFMAKSPPMNNFTATHTYSPFNTRTPPQNIPIQNTQQRERNNAQYSPHNDDNRVITPVQYNPCDDNTTQARHNTPPYYNNNTQSGNSNTPPKHAQNTPPRFNTPPRTNTPPQNRNNHPPPPFLANALSPRNKMLHQGTPPYPWQSSPRPAMNAGGVYGKTPPRSRNGSEFSSESTD